MSDAAASVLIGHRLSYGIDLSRALDQWVFNTDANYFSAVAVETHDGVIE
jgi:hypothetical protein